MKLHVRLVLAFGSCTLSIPALAASPPLPSLGADLDRTTVSGISSGGFMAAQLATAYSSRFKGVGVIAAGPYYCTGTYPNLSFLMNATTACMSPATSKVAANAAVSWKHAQEFAQQGLIDPVDNLAGQAVYAFSGSSDKTVKTMVVDEVEKYYRLAGVPPERILYNRASDAGHAIITKSHEDVPCAQTESPFINNCGFIQSQVLLKHLYGPDSKAANMENPAAGTIIDFDQREFIHGSRSSMHDNGYAYVPAYCQTKACAVHVAFHGCQQGVQRIGNRFYNGTGYNQFADSNKLIILYPQAQASDGIPANPKGCWDFWGYSNEDGHVPFYAKGATQMAAIIGMLDRLGAPRNSSAATPTQP
ncbi:Esterase PHB depolymerase [Duganella sp. CF458]|uniref:extracellular catalytic domain type 2 short-chain-length polyhydroxyalkanoate depolymerase n=1 Tax=Duganella sp. CF458 TaxID=1884368 RepID=UPI0008DF0014|nr:poly(3-hydroxybutyrate) depolymerase [Duganella sp. CF458]SFH00661.1 Esterase PHB depolymerase [Duganella sp. CF458]